MPSTTKKKYYAVRKGRIPGIYETWSDCQKQVIGFPGAAFKGFPSFAEAEAFMNGTESLADSSNADIALQLDKLDEESVVAFVDGSFHAGLKRYSFGALLFHSGGQSELSGAFADPDKIHARNVAGEIEGVKAAIKWSIEQGKKKLYIYYDYEGIEKWATGDWQAKQPLTQDYAKFYKTQSQKIKVHFRHVKAHTGVDYNEQADALAKAALHG